MNDFRYYYDKDSDDMVIEISSDDTKKVVKLKIKEVQCERIVRTVRYKEGHPRVAMKGICNGVKISDPEHAIIY